MKFFHLSDLHIGMKLYKHDLSDDQRHIFAQIVSAVREQKPNAVVIAGDIYDKSVPSAESVELFDEFVTDLTQAADTTVMIISGNHDNAERLNCFRHILNKHNVYMIGTPPTEESDHIERITLNDDFGEVRFYLLPFVKPSYISRITGMDDNGTALSYNEAMKRLIQRESIDTAHRNVLVSHQFYLPSSTTAEEIERSENEYHAVGNIDQINADILNDFDYVALGHIHKPMTVGKDCIRYCGTPMAYAVSEQNQVKGIVSVTLNEKGKSEIETLPLTPLRRVRRIQVTEDTLESFLNESSDDYVSVVLPQKADNEPIYLYDKIKLNYPNVLEIHRQHSGSSLSSDSQEVNMLKNPFELCCQFAESFGNDLDDEDKQILQDILNDLE